jgi:tRNA 2-thiouridine synthesizing protein A
VSARKPTSLEPARTLNITLDVCPMTFVKTKLELEEMEPGAILEVYVRDGESRLNVVRSCKQEGNIVHREEAMADGIWRLLIERGE